MRRLGYCHHYIVGSIPISLYATANPVLKETEVHTDISFKASLPPETWIDHSYRNCTDIIIILKINAVSICQFSLIRTESCISHIAEAGSQFQHRDKFGIYKCFIMNIPPKTQGSERSKLIICSEQ